MAARTRTRRGFLAALGLGGLIPVTDFPDWNAPQGHAKAISVTGVPLLHNKTVLGQQVAFTNIANGSSATLLNAVPVSQTSYEIVLFLRTAAAALSPVQVIITWTDSATGMNTGTERYWIYAGTTVSPHQVRGTGPTNGDQLSVGIVNNSGNTVAYEFVGLQRSLVLDRPLWQTDDTLAFAVAGAGNLALADMSGGWIASESFSAVAAGGHIDVNLPLYTGTVLIRGQTTAAAAGLGEIRILNTASTFQAFPEVDYIRILSGQSDSTQPNEMAMKAVPLQRSQSILRLINNDTSARTLTASITAYDAQ